MKLFERLNQAIKRLENKNKRKEELAFENNR